MKNAVRPLIFTKAVLALCLVVLMLFAQTVFAGAGGDWQLSNEGKESGRRSEERAELQRTIAPEFKGDAGNTEGPSRGSRRTSKNEAAATSINRRLEGRRPTAEQEALRNMRERLTYSNDLTMEVASLKREMRHYQERIANAMSVIRQNRDRLTRDELSNLQNLSGSVRNLGGRIREQELLARNSLNRFRAQQRARRLEESLLHLEARILSQEAILSLLNNSRLAADRLDEIAEQASAAND